MFNFHQDKFTYFQYQKLNAEKYVLPFIQSSVHTFQDKQVLEIGCAEGGVLKAFLDAGCQGVGVELVSQRYELAKEFLKEDIEKKKVTLVQSNIYDTNFTETYKNHFDIIILKDVIEHIFDQEKLFLEMKAYLKPNGIIYFGFPPWQMPFGGHQQICRNKYLSKAPYIHLLPAFLYKQLLQIFQEPPAIIQELLELKETGISIEKFEQITRKTGYKIQQVKHYLINPIYEYKFNLKPREQSHFISQIPVLRNFLTTCVYYTIEKE